MLLTVDIGNTTIGLAVMQGMKVVRVMRFETRLKTAHLKRRLKTILTGVCRRHTIEEVVICSVVPKVTGVVEAAARKTFHQKALVVGRDVIVPIKNRYRTPKQVGQDRLVGAFAAAEIYGVPAIVIDLGTAITLDAVSKRREYLGGLIIPGIRLSAESLFEKTALLPKVAIRKPHHVIGTNTRESILSGIFHGYGEMLKGLIAVISKEAGGRSAVVMTGGYASLMKKYVGKHVVALDADLIFKGMALLSA